jgi:hypothetical protein
MSAHDTALLKVSADAFSVGVTFPPPKSQAATMARSVTRPSAKTGLLILCILFLPYVLMW